MEKGVLINNLSADELKSLISESVKEEMKNLPQEPNQEKPRYGTRREVAKELKISLPLLHEHTKNGILKAYRIGGRVLYRWDEVYDALEQIDNLKWKRDE
jgi:excisionase family DNA binding protein